MECLEWWWGMVTEGINRPIYYLLNSRIKVQKLGRDFKFKVHLWKNHNKYFALCWSENVPTHFTYMIINLFCPSVMKLHYAPPGAGYGN